jgi:hypothetical protein
MIGLAPPERARSWQIAGACTDEAAVARLVADAVPKIARGAVVEIPQTRREARGGQPMMRLGRRASLLVALSLLALAATAHAECAWILWAGGVKTSGETVFVPIEGYPAKGECEKGRSASAVDEVEQLKRDVAGAGMKLAFTCLPDTVDPRGPKGK